MSTTRDAAETRKYYREQLGDQLGAIFYQLWNETAWLHVKWHTLLTLFGTSSERVDLLNQAAPRSFRLIEDSLWNDVLLQICALSDPPRSAGHDNLTVIRLPLLVDPRLEQLLTDLLNLEEVSPSSLDVIDVQQPGRH